MGTIIIYRTLTMFFEVSTLPLVNTGELERIRSSSNVNLNPVETPVEWGLTTDPGPVFCWKSGTFMSNCWWCCCHWVRKSSASRALFLDPRLLAASTSESFISGLGSWVACPCCAPATVQPPLHTQIHHQQTQELIFFHQGHIKSLAKVNWEDNRRLQHRACTAEHHKWTNCAWKPAKYGPSVTTRKTP